MSKNTCPIRNRALVMLTRLEKSGLTNTTMYRCLANEQERDLLTATSRLELAIKKSEDMFTELVAAGRSKAKRRAAIERLMLLRVKVR